MRKMIQEILVVVLAVVTHGMVDASDICLTRNTKYGCRPPPPLFTVPRPIWCPERDCDTQPLIIAGCSIAIICTVVTLVLCLANKTRCKPAQLIFINLCSAHLGLYVFFLVSATIVTNGSIAISFFVDFLLLASVCSLLIEAIAIWLYVRQKSIPHDVVIAVVCCWILPALKSLLTLVNRNAYYYDRPDYFLAPGRAVATADTIFIAIIFLVTVGFIAYSIWALCRAPVNGKEKEEERKEVWHRIVHLLLMCLFCYIWEFTLLGIGLICNFSFGIAFIIFGSGNGIVILVGFICRHVRKKEFREQFTFPFCRWDSSDGATLNRSPSVSPRDEEESADSKTPVIQSAQSAL